MTSTPSDKFIIGSIESFRVAMKTFADRMWSELLKDNLVSTVVQLDHACYRVATIERYEELREFFLRHADLLSEALINGRPIATFRLREAVHLNSGLKVDLIELPAPKPGKIYSEGFEHVEVVLNEPLEAFMQRHPDKNFDKANLNPVVNRDVGLALGYGLVKFHESSLDIVISLEKKALAKRQSRPIVVFDLDDTLLVSSQPFLRAMHRLLTTHLGQIDDAMVREKARTTFPEFFANFGVTDPERVGTLLRDFPGHWSVEESACRVPVGVKSVLSCLRSEGVSIHVWTARDKVTASACLDRFGLGDFVDALHAYDVEAPTAPSKPIPSKELRDLVCHNPVTVVGDSESDLAAAENLGVRFLQAGWVQRKNLKIHSDKLILHPFDLLGRILQP